MNAEQARRLENILSAFADRYGHEIMPRFLEEIRSHVDAFVRECRPNGTPDEIERFTDMYVNKLARKIGGEEAAASLKN
jgi:hypothetical protein